MPSRRVEKPAWQDLSIALVTGFGAVDDQATVPASRQRQSSVTNASGLS
jgi:hypothetical protein